MEFIQEKIRNIITKTVEKAPTYDGDVTTVDHFKLFMSSNSDNVFKISGFNICTFNCTYKEKKAVLWAMSTPIDETGGTKGISDKVIDLIEVLENTLIYIDYITSKESKEEKQILLTMVKVIE